MVVDDGTRQVVIAVFESRAFIALSYVTVVMALLPLLVRTWDTDDGKNNVSSPLPRAAEVAIGIFCSGLFAMEQIANLLVLPPIEVTTCHKMCMWWSV